MRKHVLFTSFSHCMPLTRPLFRIFFIFFMFLCFTFNNVFLAKVLHMLQQAHGAGTTDVKLHSSAPRNLYLQSALQQPFSFPSFYVITIYTWVTTFLLGGFTFLPPESTRRFPFRIRNGFIYQRIIFSANNFLLFRRYYFDN